MNTNVNTNQAFNPTNLYQPQVSPPPVQNQGLNFNQTFNQPTFQPAYQPQPGNGQPFLQQSYGAPLQQQYGQPYNQAQQYGIQNLGYAYNQPTQTYNQPPPVYSQQQSNNPYQNFQANPNISLNNSNFGALNQQITLDTKK